MRAPLTANASSVSPHAFACAAKAETSVAEEMNIVNEELSGGLEEGPGEGSQDAASHVVHLKNTLTKGSLTSSLPRARLCEQFQRGLGEWK